VTAPSRPTATGPALREFMRRWPGGIAVVTGAAAEADPVGCTVNAFISVSLRPPTLLVSLAKGSRTLAAIARHGRFCVNVLAAGQRGLVARFSGPGDRFAGVAFHWEHEVPVLDGVAAAAVCAVTRIVPAADHAMVLGTPRWSRQNEASYPIVYFAGAYYTLSHEADWSSIEPNRSTA
jgi:flavin reductase (DIM6/NTAB) family NADH-FMN oxidoreductase RutF